MKKLHNKKLVTIISLITLTAILLSIPLTVFGITDNASLTLSAERPAEEDEILHVNVSLDSLIASLLVDYAQVTLNVQTEGFAIVEDSFCAADEGTEVYSAGTTALIEPKSAGFSGLANAARLLSFDLMTDGETTSVKVKISAILCYKNGTDKEFTLEQELNVKYRCETCTYDDTSDNECNVCSGVRIVTVNGKLTKLDNLAMPSQVTLVSDLATVTPSVSEDGTFTVTTYVGDYRVAVDGYRHTSETVTLSAANLNPEIKLLQKLTADPMSWWDGGTVSESGNSATITPNSGDSNSMQEFNVGTPIVDANSWRISATVQPGATFRRGFTIAPAGADKHDEMIFIWIEDGAAGFLTWGTFKDENEADTVWTYGFDSDLTQSDYDLTLVATNINGAGTGWLSLYVNDTLVMRLENTFVGTGDRTAAGDKIDLGNVVVSLTAAKPGNAVTFFDYYYRVNEETDLPVGTVNGQVVKLDGTAVPSELSLTGGSIKKTVNVNADGTFSVTLPVGTYNIGAVEGYRGSISSITVAESNNADVELKLLQMLTHDYTWWGGGSLSESGDSATITLPTHTANGGVAHEYRVGNAFTGATSWKVSAKITQHTDYAQSGFGFGTDGAGNSTVIFFVDNWNAGFMTWGTFNDGTKDNLTVALSAEAQAAVTAEGGYTLTLVAEGINGPKTGYLALYVNDIPVLVLENTFTSCQSVHGTGGIDMNLGSGHVCLAGKYAGSSVTYTDYYMQTNCDTPLTLGTVTGNVVKLDGTAIPSTLTLSAGQINKVVSVNADGTFSVTLPVGTYNLAITADGYRCAVSSIEVTEGTKDIGDIKLLQNLTLDGGWWGGGSYTESGNSATLTVSPYNNDNGHGDSGREVRVGSAITGATSWEIGAHINDSVAANYEARRGFSVGVNGTAATLFVFVDNLGYVGWYSWDTLEHTDYDATAYPHYQLQRYAMDATSAAAVKSGSFDMKLVATGINGAGTGTLTLYINNVQVLQFENKFEGHGGRLEKDVVVDLSQVALCLAARRSGTVTTFSDYYTTYTTN